MERKNVQAGRLAPAYRQFIGRIVAAGIAVSLASAVQAGVVYVNLRASGPEDGTAWRSAFRTIQKGLNAAHPGDEVWVARGLYVENIRLRSNLSLYGGFMGTELRRGQRQLGSNTTVIDGGFRGSVVRVDDGARSTVMDGLLLRGGRASRGGGICCVNACLSVSRCRITSNLAQSGGGGVYSAGYSQLVLTNTVVRENHAPEGGGILLEGDTQASLINNTITGNGWGVGGAIRLAGGVLSAENNIIAYNSTGIDHSPALSGEAIGTSSLALANNDLFSNGDSEYVGPNDPNMWLANMAEDPQMVDWADGNCRLAAGSPCIDSGSDSLVRPGDTDLTGRARRSGEAVDMGAHEFSSGTAIAVPGARPILTRPYR